MLGSFLNALVLATIAVVATASSAIVPPELDSIGQPTQTLSVVFPIASTSVTPGQRLTGAHTKAGSKASQNDPQPQLGKMSGLRASAQYLFLMVDPDLNATHPASVGLHQLTANVTTAGTDHAASVARYIEPMPPGAAAHNYTFLLFEQPRNFTLPTKYSAFFKTTDESPKNRLNFPLDSFLVETGLGKPVAANWFRQSAVTTTATGAHKGSGSPTTSSRASTGTTGPTGTGGVGPAGRPSKGAVVLPILIVGAMFA